ncbi:MAG: CvpA family protein [Bacteroidia bacterium]|nr:MAG: CvpA family protein [Bacteroidia bacterium]
MNILDLIIAVILVLGAIRGYQKGFFYEAATLAGLVAGVFIAILLASIAGNIVESLFEWNTQVIKIVVFILVFLLVVWLIRLLGALLTKLFKALMLGFVNRIAGFALGLIKWAIILAILFMVLEFIDSGQRVIPKEIQANSSLYSILESLYSQIIDRIGFESNVENIFYVHL